MFNIGDIVRANSDAPYSVTVDGWQGVVISVTEDGRFFNAQDSSGTNFDGLDASFFTPVTETPMDGVARPRPVRMRDAFIEPNFVQLRGRNGVAFFDEASTLSDEAMQILSSMPEPTLVEELPPVEEPQRVVKHLFARNDAAVNAIQKMKDSEYGLTAVKIELEVETNIGRGMRNHPNDTSRLSSIRRQVLKGLVPLGLAEKTPSGHYRTTHPVRFAKFYNDGSVDTELTMTISMEDPTTILKLPRLLEVFNDVVEDYAANNEGRVDISKAGMHIALLNNEQCVYPFKKITMDDKVRFSNFRKSMARLLPAFYFLASCDDRSRDLNYREPKIEFDERHAGYEPHSPKYSAIAFAKGSVEFRAFETCYDKPEAVLDNIIVMGNVMDFWTLEYTPNNLQRVPKQIKFGINNGSDLARLYTTLDHLEALHEGLRILKPSFYSIRELKEQRNFTITKKVLRDKQKGLREEAQNKYVRYSENFRKEITHKEYTHIYTELYEIVEYGNPQRPLAEIIKEAKKVKADFKKSRLSKTAFVKDFVSQRVTQGSWALEGGR